MAMNPNDEKVVFLGGNMAQLTKSTGQLSLKPREAEITKEVWWRFWGEIKDVF